MREKRGAFRKAPLFLRAELLGRPERAGQGFWAESGLAGIVNGNPRKMGKIGSEGRGRERGEGRPATVRSRKVVGKEPDVSFR